MENKRRAVFLFVIFFFILKLSFAVDTPDLSTPESTVKSFLHAAGIGDFDTYLDCFSKNARQFSGMPRREHIKYLEERRRSESMKKLPEVTVQSVSYGKDGTYAIAFTKTDIKDESVEIEKGMAFVKEEGKWKIEFLSPDRVALIEWFDHMSRSKK